MNDKKDKVILEDPLRLYLGLEWREGNGRK